MIPSNDPRRLIARLAAGIAAADGHVRARELVAVTELDLLGLGHLSPIAEEEMLAAVDEPIDLGETCAGLAPLGRQTGAVILTVIAHIAASDGSVSAREREVFGTIARGLGVPVADAEHILGAALVAARVTQAPSAAPQERLPMRAAAMGSVEPPELSRACRLLGVAAGASPERLEAAYLAAVERYDPAKMVPLGPEFVRLSVRKLAEITEAFDKARAAA